MSNKDLRIKQKLREYLIKNSVYFALVCLLSLTFAIFAIIADNRYKMSSITKDYYDMLYYRLASYIMFISFLNLFFPFWQSYFLYKNNKYQKTISKQQNLVLTISYLINFVVFALNITFYLNQSFVLAYISAFTISPLLHLWLSKTTYRILSQK